MNTVSIMNDKMNTLALQLVLLVKSYLPTNERQEGQGMVEYALIIALIAIVVAATLPGVGTAIKAAFDSIAGSLS